MKRRTYSRLALLALALAVASAPMSASARPQSYEALKAKGYATGKLTKNRAGLTGWYVTGDDDQYFCRVDVFWFLGGKTGFGVFLGSGRIVPMDKNTYEQVKQLRGGTLDVPKLSDLNAGHPRPQDAGSCTPVVN